MIEIKTLSPFSKEIDRIMIRKLTFEIVLHNNLSALATPKETREKENKEKTSK